MAIIKCKMCGGDLNITEGMTVAECEYCGTRQTVPNVDNEKKVTLFSRANRLRLACEFDKAASVYESIVAEFPEEAEAYWGLVLCRYGIEYVDDPATGKKVPTCHRSSFESILKDTDFEQACENTDTVARKVYRDEAKAIEEIRKGILEVSGKEPPYDIFICYKETDENGERTIDSVLAQDVYDALTDKGYRVFFSRISLEDKLGTEYEPYIFAALNSAKVMLVFGTDYEYFNAVWVKNEWSRFLKLMAQDKSKHLIPCYKDVDAYDLPEEFQKLQAQDLGKVGAVQDLLRGIDKLLGKTTPVQASADGPTAESLLKRGQMFLTDGEWASAREYFHKVLDINPECGACYLGLFMVQHQLSSWEQVENLCLSSPATVQADANFLKAEQFADETLKEHFSHLSKRQEALQQAKAGTPGKKDRLASCRRDIAKARGLIAMNEWLALGVQANGSLQVDGDPDFFHGVQHWTEIAAVSTGLTCVVGLRKDHTVTIDDADMNAEATSWDEITAVSAGEYVAGLRKDGTVVVAGCDSDLRHQIEDWTQVAAITTARGEYGGECIIGLRENGTLIAAGEAADEYRNIRKWKHLVAVDGCCGTVIGLKEDGTVAVSALNDKGQTHTNDWTDMIAVAAGETHVVGLRADGTVAAAGTNDAGECQVDQWQDIVAIAAGEGLTVGLQRDGTVLFTGCRYADAAGWKLFGKLDTLDQERMDAEENREALEEQHQNELARSRDHISAAQHRVAVLGGFWGLHADGTVQRLIAGLNNGSGMTEGTVWQGIAGLFRGSEHVVALNSVGTPILPNSITDNKTRLALQSWSGLIDFASTHANYFGLRADGTVLRHCWMLVQPKDEVIDTSGWRGIRQLAAGFHHVVGLREDGTVTASGLNSCGQCNVSAWNEIVSISARGNHTVGLQADGTVRFVGSPGEQDKKEELERALSEWSDIIAVDTSANKVAGVRMDGTVCLAGASYQEKEAIKKWKGIVAVAVADDGILGLKSNGALVGTYASPALKPVYGWRLFRTMDALKKETQEMRQEAGSKRKKALEAECTRLQTELANLKGLFTGKRRRELEARLAEIEAELKKL